MSGQLRRNHEVVSRPFRIDGPPPSSPPPPHNLWLRPSARISRFFLGLALPNRADALVPLIFLLYPPENRTYTLKRRTKHTKSQTESKNHMYHIRLGERGGEEGTGSVFGTRTCYRIPLTTKWLKAGSKSGPVSSAGYPIPTTLALVTSSSTCLVLFLSLVRSVWSNLLVQIVMRKQDVRYAKST